MVGIPTSNHPNMVSYQAHRRYIAMPKTAGQFITAEVYIASRE
jgi:hypothetical protein